MNKMVNCRMWKEYDGMNGVVMFCEAAAYNKKLTEDEQEKVGCNNIKMKLCKKLMEFNMGGYLLPAVEEAAWVKEKEKVKVLK